MTRLALPLFAALIAAAAPAAAAPQCAPRPQVLEILADRYGEGRRLFKMAPLHHHFEKSGWRETQVVVRFWIITMLLCLIGLSTLKLR